MEEERRSPKKRRRSAAQKAPTKDLLCFPSQQVDRISELPVDIRVHILSFLTTKSAVKMGVLSKRWARLWTSSPVLRFDQQDFLSKRWARLWPYSPYLRFEDQDLLAAATTSFVNFVDRALALRHRRRSITRFELWWKHGFDISKAKAWLSYAISHNVQELVLSMWSSMENRLLLPLNIFCCPSLQHLVVTALESSARVRWVPSSMQTLSKLRILRLENILGADPGMLPQLISVCPLLECLKIPLQGHGTVHISAPNLRKLVLRWYMFDKDSRVTISAPRLEILKCAFLFNNPDITLGELQSLVYARISCFNITRGNGAKLLRILTDLRDTKIQTLILENQTIEVLSTVPDLPKHMSSTLCCLKYLELEAMLNEDNIRIIIILLKSFITVEKLVIHNSKNGRFPWSVNGLEDGWCPHNSDYDCSLYNLKEIEINGFLGARDEFELVKLLLRSANTLRSMILNYRKEFRDQETWLEISQNLQCIIPRASSSAEVRLSTMA